MPHDSNLSEHVHTLYSSIQFIFVHLIQKGVAQGIEHVNYI